jgi:hypothetical protein
MPQGELKRSYEAMRRLLPELTKLARYEHCPGAGEIELSVNLRNRPKIALSLKRLRQILLNEPKLFLLVEIPTRHEPRRASRQR